MIIYPSGFVCGQILNAPHRVVRPVLCYKDQVKDNLKSLDICFKGWEPRRKVIKAKWYALIVDFRNTKFYNRDTLLKATA